MITSHTRIVVAGAVAAFLVLAVAADRLDSQPAEGDQRSGPWDFNLVSLVSGDGLSWREQGVFVERAGVATMLEDRQGRLVALFQWFPEGNVDAFDRVASVVSTDQGRTWSPPRPIVVEGMPKDLRRPFDPTLVELEDGRFRLYFTSHQAGEGGELRPGDDLSTGIHSAVSRDGVNFNYEPGLRFGVDGEMVIDCSVVYWSGEWHIFAPIQGKPGAAYHAASRDGLAFVRLEDASADTRGTWLGCAVPATNGLRFYGSGRGGWCAVSSDARTWRMLADATRPVGMDPAVVRMKNGAWLMVATGEMRAEARERVGRSPREIGAAEPAARNSARRAEGWRGGTGTEPGPRGDPAAITANDKFVYVLRHGVLHKLDAESLVLLKSVRLPDDAPDGFEGPPAPQRK